MKYQKAFEVKTGKNKGFYIVTKSKNLMDTEAFKLMANCWGMMPYEYNSGFYQYHSINATSEVVWTHSRYCGHEYSQEMWNALLDKLTIMDLPRPNGAAF